MIRFLLKMMFKSLSRCNISTATMMIIGFLFMFNVSAQPINTDLSNLKTASSTIVAAYDKIKIFDAWDIVNSLHPPIIATTTIGIIDTGIDASGVFHSTEGIHPEFVGVNFGRSTPFSLQDRAVEFLSILTFGHGTSVAGIIGANNISATQVLPPDSPQMNGIISGITDKYVLDSRTAYFLHPLTLQGFGTIIDNMLAGTIVNISFTHKPKSEDFNDARNYFSQVYTGNYDKTFVLAAGNDEADVQEKIASNINLPNTIIVAATKLDDQRANFSNFGQGVDISAPGVNVYAPSVRGEGNFPQNDGNYITFFSGTSASAPMVTGVAGLIKAIKPDLTPAQIKQILIETGDPITTDKPIGPRLNAHKAVCHSLVLNCAPPPPPPATPIWPMLQKDSQHSGLSEFSGPAFATSSEVKVKWQRNLGSTWSFSPLIGSNGAVYMAGRHSAETSSILYALNGQTGETIWQAPIPGIAYAGALGSDNTIYICSNGSIQGTLSAFRPSDGQNKWSFVVGGPTPCMDPVIDKEGVIYTAVPPPLNIQTAAVVAINPDGTQRWRYEEINNAVSSPAISKDESRVYVAFGNHLSAFSADNGDTLWSQEGAFAFSLAPLVNSQDNILITSNLSLYDQGYINAYSKSGVPLWISSNLGPIVGSPATDNQGQISIISSYFRKLFILNSQDGSIDFSVPLSVIPSGSRSIIDKNNVVYNGFSDDMNFITGPGIAAVDNSGVKWLFLTTPERIVSTPALGKNNVIYFTSDNTIWALGE